MSLEFDWASAHESRHSELRCRAVCPLSAEFFVLLFANFFLFLYSLKYLGGLLVLLNAS